MIFAREDMQISMMVGSGPPYTMWEGEVPVAECDGRCCITISQAKDIDNIF